MTKVNLITLTDPRSAVAEAYRTLRANLIFGTPEKPITTLVVTSTAQPDNKSIALANLAVTFAQAGHTTILVDGDLRKPTQHTVWGVENSRGLMTMMTDVSALATPPLLPTGVENLSLLPAGGLPEVPADAISSRRMDEIIGVLKARANYVLFDAPPVLAASDAALLGHKVDGVLLIVQSGKTRRDDAQKARQALERIQVRVLGAALTNAPRDSMVNYR